MPDRVLIAGGGIGGLMTALTLAKSGFTVHLVERTHEFPEVGAGVQLGPNATRILRKWQVLDRLVETQVAPREVRMLDAVSNAVIGSIPLGDRIAQRFGAPYLVTHRADLQAALLQACSECRGIIIETGHAVAGFEQSAGGVDLHTDTGRTLKGKALIGADGLWSTVRARLLQDGAPDFAHHTAYRTLIARDAMPADCAWNAAALWAGPGSHVVHYPVSGGRSFNIVAIGVGEWHAEGWSEPADSSEVTHRFAAMGPQVKAILAAGRNFRKWALADRPPAARWSHGRVTLLGDAAHPVLPYLAQGAAMAIEDADRIAECICQTGGDAEKAFALYQAARQPRARRLYQASRAQGRIYHARGITRLLRNRFMTHLSAERWYKRVEWIYGGP